MPAATFFFRAVASDGKVRSGSLTGDTVYPGRLYVEEHFPPTCRMTSA